MDNLKSKEQTVKLLERVAMVSGVFALILCVLIIVNFIQVKRTDPLNTPVMTILLENLKNNPDDDQLRNEIREIDLIARKAYFTSQWQIRSGGYILFASMMVLIICLQWISLLKAKIPVRPGAETKLFWETRSIHRRWIIYAGVFLVTGSLVLAFLTYQELGKALSAQQFPDSTPQDVMLRDTIAKETESAALAENRLTRPDSTPASLTTRTVVITKPDTNQVAANPATPEKAFPSRAEILNNWLTFRGPDGNGVTRDKGYPVSWNGSTGLNIKWKTELPLPGYNSPVVWKNRIFLSGADATKREIYCLDIASGTMLWTTDVSDVPGTPSTVPKIDSETGYAAPTMTTDGKQVYAIFATGDLVALDMKGIRVWSKNLGLPKNHYGHSSSLIMYRDLLIVQWDQSQGASVKAFSGVTGELVWNTPRNVKVSWASPVLANTGTRMELILAADPSVASYDPATGNELWKVDCISGEVGPSVAYAGGIVFSTNEYSKLAAVKLGEIPSSVWESSDYMSDIPSPVANENFLFLVTSYGTVVCYDAKSGEEYWIQELEKNVYASPVIVGEKVYLLDKTGVMHIFRAGKAYESIGSSPLGEESVCTPAFVDGRIYIRGDKNLYCVGN